MKENCTAILGKWRTIVLLHFRNGRQLCCYNSEMEDNCAFTLGKWRKIVQFTSRKKRETVFTHGNGRSHHHKVTMYISEMAGQIMQFTPEKRRTSKMDRWENGGRNCQSCRLEMAPSLVSDVWWDVSQDLLVDQLTHRRRMIMDGRIQRLSLIYSVDLYINNNHQKIHNVGERGIYQTNEQNRSEN